MNNEPFTLAANIDLKQDFYVNIKCCQYDDIILQFNVYDNGKYLDLSDYTIEMNMLKPDKTIYYQNSMVTTSGNTVSMTCTEQLSIVGGNGIGSILLIEKSTKKKKYSFNFEIYIKPSPIADGVNSKSTITLLDQIQDALDELRDISVNLTEAVQVNSELKSNIATGKILNDDLISNIDTADEINNTLVANTNSADEINNTLVSNTSTAKSVNNDLEGNIATGKSVNVDLTNNIAEGNKTNDTAATINNTLEVNIEEGKKTIDDLTNVNKDYSKHINNMKIHLTEDEKEQFLLLFQNFITLQNKVDRLIGDGFLSDEDGNIYVDENGDTYIT